MHNFGGGRSDLTNSGFKRGGGVFSKFRGVAKRGELKNSGGFGPWMKLWLWEGCNPAPQYFRDFFEKLASKSFKALI